MEWKFHVEHVFSESILSDIDRGEHLSCLFSETNNSLFGIARLLVTSQYELINA